MLPKINPTSTAAWKALLHHAGLMKDQSLTGLFHSPNRFQEFAVTGAGIRADFSKNHLTKETRDLLVQLANECGLAQAMDAMKSGEAINEREDRPVLHVALRSTKSDYQINGKSVQSQVKAELEKVRRIADGITNGTWMGYTGKPIRHVVNIGIGGSDLGPKMVCQALNPYNKSGITAWFLSNVDASQWEEIRPKINPDETLFIIASKTFTTDETMTNARTVRQWFLASQPEVALANHFVAVSTNLAEVAAFSIPPENILGFWDWVGGRFSLWSAIGLSVACIVGYENFEELLRGAEAMDTHFFEAPFEQNLPVMKSLVDLWYSNFWSLNSRAILPYDQRLAYFPAYLQQLMMESNGKQVDRLGQPVNYATSPTIWGEPGTNGQHAFYQLLHQGTEIIPCDFIAVAHAHHPHDQHQVKLLANCFAQSQALMEGRDHTDPFKKFDGNRPSTTLLLDSITPFNLGNLIALYEHEVFVQGIIWNIFSFDQWGVELGKAMAKEILEGKSKTENDSTAGLMAWTR
jgi:glucose-6-phosphate isomerase